MNKTLKFILLCAFLFVSSLIEAAQLHKEDFEGPDFVGYSTLQNVFTIITADYLERGTNGAPFNFPQPVTGFLVPILLAWKILMALD